MLSLGSCGQAILEGGAEELAASAIEEAYPNVKQELEESRPG